MNNSDRENQMPYDFMWDLKNGINKQYRNKHIDTEEKINGCQVEVVGGWVKKVMGLRSTSYQIQK